METACGRRTNPPQAKALPQAVKRDTRNDQPDQRALGVYSSLSRTPSPSTHCATDMVATPTRVCTT